MMRVLTSVPGFVCVLVIMILFAYWQPALGASEQNLKIKYISELLVIMIFLFQGSRLKIENLSLLFQRPVGSLVLQAGIIFLPVLWVKIGWAVGLVPQGLYGPLFFSAILPTYHCKLCGFFEECRRKCGLCLGSRDFIQSTRDFTGALFVVWIFCQRGCIWISFPEDFCPGDGSLFCGLGSGSYFSGS
jgi:hypothetical protein